MILEQEKAKARARAKVNHKTGQDKTFQNVRVLCSLFGRFRSFNLFWSNMNPIAEMKYIRIPKKKKKKEAGNMLTKTKSQSKIMVTKNRTNPNFDALICIVSEHNGEVGQFRKRDVLRKTREGQGEGRTI